MEAQIGTRIAGYRIESVIGRGGMGVVYLAEDLSLQRKVALKVLAPELSEDPKFRERFVRESRLAAALDHPNIVPIFEAREADGQLYIAMRYVQGMDLKTLIREQGALDLERALWILTQAGSALDAAHGAGLVHRDVKPGNILIATATDSGAAEHVYLSDFGLTKRTSSESGMTATGQFVGTLDYAAPEQFEGRPLDARTDVYSLGCVFYECLTGEVPFKRENEAGLVYAHLLAPPPKVTERRPELPPRLDSVVAKAMAKSPDDRFLTAGALARAAREAVPGVLARREGFFLRGRQLVAMLVAFALIVTGAVTAVMLTRGGPPGPATLPKAPADSVAMIDPSTNRMVGWVPVAGYPDQIVASGDSLWVSSRRGWTVSRIDPKSRKVVATVQLGSEPTGLAAGQFGSVWVATGLADSVVQIDPQTNRIFQSLELQGCCSGPSSIAVDGATVWVTNATGAQRVQPGTDPPVIARVPGTGTAGAVVDLSHHVWVSNGWDTVSVIEPFGDTVAYSVRVPGGPAGLALGPAGIYVAAGQTGEVSRISPDQHSVQAAIPVGHGPTSMAVSADAVWVANASDGTVSRIDTKQDSVVATVPVGARVGGVAFAGGRVWATIQSPEATAAVRGKLAFDDGGDIYVMNADGTGLKQLTKGPEEDADPAWSPDGTRIAFARDGGQGSRLFVMKADGTGLTQVTQGRGGDDFDVAWSPDGSKLAFGRDRGTGGSSLWVVNVDGTGARDLTPKLEAEIGRLHGYPSPSLGRPDWSIDGKTILFRSNPEGVLQLYTIRPDGTGLTQLTNDAGRKDAPVWSPDGVRIAYSGEAGVYLTLPAAGTVGARIVRNQGQGRLFPSWSPDGTVLALLDATGPRGGSLWLVNTDGTGLVRLTKGVSAGIPDWQPVLGSDG